MMGERHGDRIIRVSYLCTRLGWVQGSRFAPSRNQTGVSKPDSEDGGVVKRLSRIAKCQKIRHGKAICMVDMVSAPNKLAIVS